MIFSHIAPSPALQEFVRDYLIAHFVFDDVNPAGHKPYPPKPEQGITFFVGDRPRMVNLLTGEAEEAPRASIFGQQVVRCDVRLPAEFLMLRVHFRPGALFRALNVPLNEFDGSYFDAELVAGREVRDLSEQLAGTRSYVKMVALVERYLLGVVKRARQDVHRVDRAASRLMADPAHGSLDRLAAEACLSPRQLNRKFTERLGVGPKLYSRLARFHHAHVFKAAHPVVAWATVAMEFGYTDYQHMVRDFKQFANATPRAWLLEDAASPEIFLARCSAHLTDASRSGRSTSNAAVRKDVRFVPRERGERGLP